MEIPLAAPVFLTRSSNGERFIAFCCCVIAVESNGIRDRSAMRRCVPVVSSPSLDKHNSCDAELVRTAEFADNFVHVHDLLI